MAKKRAKKATRRASKAKRSTARRRERLAVDPATGQAWMFDPKTGKPVAVGGRTWADLSPAERKAEEQRREQVRAQSLERRARRQARFAMRPPEMRSRDYALPEELQEWLLSLFSAAEIDRFFFEQQFAEGETDPREVEAKCHDFRQFVLEWYLQGCRQGYIEGRVALRMQRREVSDKRNRRKRELPTADGEPTLDERDAMVFSHLPDLKAEFGAEEAERRMAKVHGISERRVRQIFLEQTVLRERAALVQEGFGEAAAAEQVVSKHGVDKHGKPSLSRQAKVREILAKSRLRTLPEMP